MVTTLEVDLKRIHNQTGVVAGASASVGVL